MLLLQTGEFLTYIESCRCITWLRSFVFVLFLFNFIFTETHCSGIGICSVYLIPIPYMMRRPEDGEEWLPAFQQSNLQTDT